MRSSFFLQSTPLAQTAIPCKHISDGLTDCYLIRIYLFYLVKAVANVPPEVLQ